MADDDRIAFGLLSVLPAGFRRVHSRYRRTLADLPCGGETLCLHVWVRRLFCGNPHNGTPGAVSGCDRRKLV